MVYFDRDSVSFLFTALLCMISIHKDTLWVKMAAGTRYYICALHSKNEVEEEEEKVKVFLLRTFSGSSSP